MGVNVPLLRARDTRCCAGARLSNNIHGGPEGIRTPDLLNAIQTRSQLRHGPTAETIGHDTRPVRGRPPPGGDAELSRTWWALELSVIDFEPYRRREKTLQELARGLGRND